MSNVIQPRILYDNLLQGSGVSISVSSETAEQPGSNAYNNRSDQAWKPAASGAQNITADFSNAVSVNAFCFARTDAYVNSGTISLEHSDDDLTYTPMFIVSPDDEGAYYRWQETAESHRYWRVVMDSTPESELALVAFGVDFNVPEGQYTGSTPPFLNRADRVQINQTEGATFVGAAILSENCKVNFSYKDLSQDFIRDTWDGFRLAARTRPWWLLWNPENRPDEADWCFPEGAPGNPRNASNGLMDTSIKANAIPKTVTLTQ